ncbi:MAG: hypothetical protein ACK5LN_15000 [Propioniciclava sp.]
MSGLVWGGVKKFQAAPLDVLGKDIGALIAVLREQVGVVVGIVPVGWRGVSATAARGKQRMMVDQLEALVMEVTAVRTALFAAADRVEVVERKVAGAIDFAAENNLVIADDGSVSPGVGGLGGVGGCATGNVVGDVYSAEAVCGQLVGEACAAAREIDVALAVVLGRVGRGELRSVNPAGVGDASVVGVREGQLPDVGFRGWESVFEDGPAGLGFGRWLDDVLRFPEEDVASVGAANVSAWGSFSGFLANLFSGRDWHLFDDGRPLVGDPYRVDNGDLVTDFRSLAVRTMAAYNNGRNEKDPYDGDVQVVVVRDADGSNPRYVVTIPGTEADPGQLDGWAGGKNEDGRDNGHEWFVNLEMVGFGRSTYTAAVEEAIDMAVREDRLKYPGELGRPRVLLAGQSQGGIHAAAVAANPEFAGRYQVDAVVTWGSPIDTIDVPESVPVLAIEHSMARDGEGEEPRDPPARFGDPVANLDLGGAPLGRSDSVTLVNLPPRPGTSVFDTELNHDYDSYRESTAEMMDPGNAGLAEQRAVVQGFEDEYLSDYYADSDSLVDTWQVPAGRVVR